MLHSQDKYAVIAVKCDCDKCNLASILDLFKNNHFMKVVGVTISTVATVLYSTEILYQICLLIAIRHCETNKLYSFHTVSKKWDQLLKILY